MRVSELAKEFNTTSPVVLEKLKNLKLKAKDENQDLNAAVVIVLRSELKNLVPAGRPKPAVPAVDPSRRPKWDRAEVKEPLLKKKEEKQKEPTVFQDKKTLKKEEHSVSKGGKVKEIKATAKAKTTKPKIAAKPKKAPVKAKAEKAEKVKKAAPKVVLPAEILKPKPIVKISDEPFVSLKPLLKKRRPMPHGAGAGKRGFPGETRPASSGPFSTPATSAAQFPPGGEDNRILQDIEIKLPIAVKDLAVKFQQKPSAILKQLMFMGLLVNINQNLDEDVVKKLAQDFGFNLIKVKSQEEQLVELHEVEKEDPSKLKPRAPVITFMGHVDHGKTSLLDRVRKSRVADKEHGGITQHIGAYSVKTPKGIITFLDTPGHEAFTAMRARGAHITDIVVLVVAADEGIMPQTEEAIDHARAAQVPIVVALNKIDKKNADVDRVKKQLMEKGLTPEDWGGKTITVGVSAFTGEGVDQLLEMILLEAELLELKANYDKRASGIVVEAHLSQGKGALATLIVQNGTLRDTDTIVVGPYYGRVKALFDDYERPIKEAGPSMPVEILGLPGVPDAGELFYVVEDERHARDIAYRRRDQIKEQKIQSYSKITLEDLYSQIQEGKLKELKVILKTDVQGSMEALVDSLKKIPSDQVQLNIIHTGVGEINASDVILAVASDAIVIGFNVDTDTRGKQELEKNPVDVRTYRIIYDAVNDIKKALEGLLEPRTRKKFLSRVEIREVFKLSRSGVVAGCSVQKGKVIRRAHVDVVRNGETVFSGTIASLKRFKDDVKEVAEGVECGITISGYDKVLAGDVLEVYEIEKIARTL